MKEKYLKAILLLLLGFTFCGITFALHIMKITVGDTVVKIPQKLESILTILSFIFWIYGICVTFKILFLNKEEEESKDGNSNHSKK